MYFPEESGRVAALLIPDKEHPLFHISAEARDRDTAEAMAAELERKVIRWRDEP
jgi:phosphomannomutase